MLIDFNALDRQKERQGDALSDDIQMVEEIAFDHLKRTIISRLQKRCAFQFVTNAHWSMHQLLQAILHVSGPADVYISSYAFSELPARVIADNRREGLIRRLSCIIDNRIDVRSAGALQILKNAADRIKLCATHAKITVVENEVFHFVVICSANYTTNKRYESGVIIESEKLAKLNTEWITDEINKPE